MSQNLLIALSFVPALIGVTLLWRVYQERARASANDSVGVAQGDQWDFPIWKAIQYILHETPLGASLPDNAHANVAWDLKVQATNPDYGRVIRVWAKPTQSDAYEQIPLKRLVGGTYSGAQPSDKDGTVQFQDGDVWYSPRFNRDEIEAAFRERPPAESDQSRQIREGLAGLIKEGQEFKRRAGDVPFPIKGHNEWVERVESFLRKHLDASYVVRLSDFTGLTFFGDGSEKSKIKNTVDGRLRRLHEFLKEIR